MNTFNLDQRMSEEADRSTKDTISATERAIILHAIRVALESTNHPDEIATYKQTAARIRKMKIK